MILLEPVSVRTFFTGVEVMADPAMDYLNWQAGPALIIADVEMNMWRGHWIGWIDPGLRWFLSINAGDDILVGASEHEFYFPEYGIILPIDFHIFQDG